MTDVADRPVRAHAPLAVALGGAACVLGMALIGPLVSSGAAEDAGIFAFLFGNGAKPAPVAARHAPARPLYTTHARREAPPAVRAWRPPVRVAARMSFLTGHPRKVARKPRALAPVVAAFNIRSKIALIDHTIPRKPSRPVSLLADETLRPGDAVMTAQGIRIFKAAHRIPYTGRDFRPLAFAGQVPHRRALLAIDRAIRRPDWSSSFAPMSPVAAAWRPPADGETASRVIETVRRS